MERSMDFCRSKAAEYARRAEEATDREMRDFFYRLRDNWVRVARAAEMRDDAHPETSGASSATHRDQASAQPKLASY